MEGGCSPVPPQHATALCYRVIPSSNLSLKWQSSALRTLRTKFASSAPSASFRCSLFLAKLSIYFFPFRGNSQKLVDLEASPPSDTDFTIKFGFRIHFGALFGRFLASPGQDFQNLCHSNLHSVVIKELSSHTKPDSENRLNCDSGKVWKSSVR